MTEYKKLFEGAFSLMTPEDQELLLATVPSKKAWDDAMKITETQRAALTSSSIWFLNTEVER